MCLTCIKVFERSRHRLEGAWINGGVLKHLLRDCAGAFIFDMENEDLNKDMVREMVLEEILQYQQAKTNGRL